MKWNFIKDGFLPKDCSIGKVFNYISRTMLHKGTRIQLRCFNLNEEDGIDKESIYLFEVI